MVKKALASVRWQLRLGGHAEYFLHDFARRWHHVGFVDDLHDDGNRGELADLVSARQKAIAKAGLAILEGLRLPAQHQLGKIDVPRMGRNVRAFGHEAEVAQVTLIDDLPEIRLRNAIDFHRLAVVDEVEQRRESAAQRHAAPTAMTDIKDPLHLLVERFFVVELGIAPVERVARGRVEVAFTERHGFPQPQDGWQTCKRCAFAQSPPIFPRIEGGGTRPFQFAELFRRGVYWLNQSEQSSAATG